MHVIARERRSVIIRLAATATVVLAGWLTGACAASAEPPRFPDMTGYATANPEEYKNVSVNPGRPTDSLTSYNFRTPEGIRCGYIEDTATCSGNNLPGVPSAHWDPSNGFYGVNVISTNSQLRQISDSTPPDVVDSYKTLPPFHTLTVNGITCGVNDSGTTACKKPGGGAFMISKQGVAWLPHE